MVPIVCKVVLKFATTMNGAPSVMIVGEVMMLQSYADNWDSLRQVQTDTAVKLVYIC